STIYRPLRADPGSCDHIEQVVRIRSRTMMRIMASLTKEATVSLEITCQAIAADPGQGSFDDPALGLGQDDEFVKFIALDDLEHPTARAGSRSRGAWFLIASIGEDALDKGQEAASASIDNQPRPVAVLNVAGMDDDVQQKAERIDEDVALAPGDLLARVKPLRVKRGAPF